MLLLCVMVSLWFFDSFLWLRRPQQEFPGNGEGGSGAANRLPRKPAIEAGQ
jgi:hypothetical protein